ncbi:MAG: hypothetical protein RMJ16_13580 [Thermoguttaceae bacterium]|nr:hypothetical protein [Thermoguttaceae bacterium]
MIHPWVDLDAAACVALTGVAIEDVYFLPANATEIPECLKHARILDHPLGLKGFLESNGLQHSAAASLPEAADLAESDFLLEVEEQDMQGYAQPRYSLARILACVRAYFRDQKLAGEELDRAVLRIIVPVLRAIAHAERQNRQVRQSPLPEVEVGPYRFVLRLGPSDEPPMLPRGYAGIIYQDGFNLGVVRHPRRRELDFRILREDLPGWFIHSTGFMACWGSFKAPASGPPPEGTPRTAAELAELLRQKLVPVLCPPPGNPPDEPPRSHHPPAG